jgi:hypothetical protein
MSCQLLRLPSEETECEEIRNSKQLNESGDIPITSQRHTSQNPRMRSDFSDVIRNSSLLVYGSNLTITIGDVSLQSETRRFATHYPGLSSST